MNNNNLVCVKKIIFFQDIYLSFRDIMILLEHQPCLLLLFETMQMKNKYRFHTLEITDQRWAAVHRASYASFIFCSVITFPKLEIVSSMFFQYIWNHEMAQYMLCEDFHNVAWTYTRARSTAVHLCHRLSAYCTFVILL